MNDKEWVQIYTLLWTMLNNAPYVDDTKINKNKNQINVTVNLFNPGSGKTDSINIKLRSLSNETYLDFLIKTCITIANKKVNHEFYRFYEYVLHLANELIVTKQTDKEMKKLKRKYEYVDISPLEIDYINLYEHGLKSKHSYGNDINPDKPKSRELKSTAVNTYDTPAEYECFKIKKSPIDKDNVYFRMYDTVLPKEYEFQQTVFNDSSFNSLLKELKELICDGPHAYIYDIINKLYEDFKNVFDKVKINQIDALYEFKMSNHCDNNSKCAYLMSIYALMLDILQTIEKTGTSKVYVEEMIISIIPNIVKYDLSVDFKIRCKDPFIVCNECHTIKITTPYLMIYNNRNWTNGNWSKDLNDMMGDVYDEINCNNIIDMHLRNMQIEKRTPQCLDTSCTKIKHILIDRIKEFEKTSSLSHKYKCKIGE